ncbi:MAG: hypothetical protein ACE5H1_10895, partial [Thermodesulfobacteriota bacterium]
MKNARPLFMRVISSTNLLRDTLSSSINVFMVIPVLVKFFTSFNVSKVALGLRPPKNIGNSTCKYP